MFTRVSISTDGWVVLNEWVKMIEESGEKITVINDPYWPDSYNRTIWRWHNHYITIDRAVNHNTRIFEADTIENHGYGENALVLALRTWEGS